MPPRRQPVVTERQMRELDDGHLAGYVPGVWTRLVAPRHWDSETGETWPVSDEALRVWARREGFDPDAVVAWERDRFQGGRRSGPPPRVVWVDAERAARGTSRTPRELEPQRERGAYNAGIRGAKARGAR